MEWLQEHPILTVLVAVFAGLLVDLAVDVCQSCLCEASHGD